MILNTPPKPTAAIASRSATMPSRETLPFIQCHHTSGLAESGGARNVSSKASPPITSSATPAVTRKTASP